MEQIMPNVTILFQAVIFLVALYVIKTFILDPVSQVLRNRTERIEGAEQEARRFQEESARLDSSYRARIAEARARAQQERARNREEARGKEKEILGKGRLEAQEILEGIRGQIRQESAEAKARLHEDAAGLSSILAEKLLGRPVS